MTFTILPAIDVYRGRLARYTPAGPEPVDAFAGDPVRAAEAFVAGGCGWLHVVDMALAFDGEPAAEVVVASIRRRCPDVSIQMSGGITTLGTARRYLDAGATRFVMGSAALADEAAASELLKRAGVEAIVGLEVQGGRIMSRGRVRVDLDLRATIAWLIAEAPNGFLVTSVERVGELGGPDTALISQVAASGVATVAAGGIATAGNLERVREAGAVGAVVGRGALDGGLDLVEALAWAAADPR